MLHSRWFWIAFAILVFWALGAYNRLVRLRAQVKQQFGPLQAVLLDYQEVVQQAVTAAATAPQLWDLPGNADLGHSYWTRLQVAAGLSTVAIARMQNHTLDQDSAQSLHDAAAELQDAWAALIHPDVYFINIPDHLKQLAGRWANPKSFLAYARATLQQFNMISKSLNNKFLVTSDEIKKFYVQNN
jgi:LemA protein